MEGLSCNPQTTTKEGKMILTAILLRLPFIPWHPEVQKTVNPSRETDAYSRLAEQFIEPSCDAINMRHTTTVGGEKIYYFGGLKELFPGDRRPTDRSLQEIAGILKLKSDLTPPYIWLCLNVHADAVMQNEKIMSILRHDSNATYIAD